MSVLNVIRKQENPDGLQGHEERLRMQEDSRRNPVKRVFAKGRDFHNYSCLDVKRESYNKELLLLAKEFCRTLCCNDECPLRGI